jgi:two-component system response regulator VicR
MNMEAKILLVEDDENLGFITKEHLVDEGFNVVLAKNGKEGFKYFSNEKFDLCLLDVMMPVRDGFSLAQDIRKMDQNTPIIFLTAKSMQEDKIKGFTIGGDDYLTKPFSAEELVLRIKAVLKRYFHHHETAGKQGDFTFSKCSFNLKEQRLITPTMKYSLTKKEAEVLNVLCRNLNKVVTREVALKMIYGEDDYFKGRSMDVYIAKIRKYLKDDDTVEVQNIHGTGFKLLVE